MRLKAPERCRELHLVAMGVSYVALLTGFYVDNGRNCPGGGFSPDGASGFFRALSAVPSF